MTNPLEQYFRAPKLYIKLPSQMAWYEPDMVETAANGEIPVYPMTALDQITIKTPDALLNGEALIKVVASCLPTIKNARLLVEPDINTVLLAIRIATAGKTLDIDTPCPHCQHENRHQVDLTAILETQQFLDTNHTVDLDSNLLVHIRPYNFEQRNLTLLNEVEHTQTLRLLESREDLDETHKVTELGKHITVMAERTFEIVAKSVTHVTIIKTGTQVTDPDHIKEFVQNLSKAQADAIMTKIKELNDSGIDTTCNLVCDSCGEPYAERIDFDPVSFFG